MRLLLSLAALLLSIAFVQLGSGALIPLDALSGIALGFSTTEIGLLGSAHFVGFFLGCWLAPRMIGSVGHIRAFSAFAVSGAIGALAHPLFIDPVAWAGMRVMTGFAVAGAYTVIEVWLQARVTNETRGRVLGVYRLVDLTASLVAQMMIAVLEPVSYISYNIVAILCCLCLLPLALTRAPEPPVPEAPRLRPWAACRLSPLGAAGVVVAGVTNPAFRMVGPVYGSQMGHDTRGIALFLGAAVLGGALAQLPAGWLADKYDRRTVMVAISVAAVAVCAGMGTLGLSGPGLLLGALVFGVVTFPIFSLAAAHANDFARPEEMTELNAALMFLYGVGAIASPLVASSLIEAFGPPALFALVAAGHGFLIAFALWRMGVRPKPDQAPYRDTPRTSFLIGRLVRRR